MKFSVQQTLKDKVREVETIRKNAEKIVRIIEPLKETRLQEIELQGTAKQLTKR
jgi:hypothetical protein